MGYGHTHIYPKSALDGKLDNYWIIALFSYHGGIYPWNPLHDQTFAPHSAVCPADLGGDAA